MVTSRAPSLKLHQQLWQKSCVRPQSLNEARCTWSKTTWNFAPHHFDRTCSCLASIRLGATSAASPTRRLMPGCLGRQGPTMALVQSVIIQQSIAFWLLQCRPASRTATSWTTSTWSLPWILSKPALDHIRDPSRAALGASHALLRPAGTDLSRWWTVLRTLCNRDAPAQSIHSFQAEGTPNQASFFRRGWAQVELRFWKQSNKFEFSKFATRQGTRGTQLLRKWIAESSGNLDFSISSRV